MTDRVAYLASVLRSRLIVTEARAVTSRPGSGMRDGVTPTPRLLLILKGTIRYQIEDHSHRVVGPTLLLVPAHSRRQWACEHVADVVYFSFETDVPAAGLGALVLRGKPARSQARAMQDLCSIIQSPDSGQSLLAEAEAKAVLARFLLRAEPLMPQEVSAPQDKRVAAAIRWLQDHLGEVDPLEKLHERADLSAAYFRAEFRRLTGQTPSAYLNALRMRTARFQLAETTAAIKQIARQVGFTDPLYFSRRYHRFWKRSPSDERAGR